MHLMIGFSQNNCPTWSGGKSNRVREREKGGAMTSSQHFNEHLSSLQHVDKFHLNRLFVSSVSRQQGWRVFFFFFANFTSQV